VESDRTGPRSAYGRSKLAGEFTTAEANERHAIVRTSWLFGVAGKNFVDTMLRLEGELKVVDDQVGCPTYTGHLAEALVDLAGGRMTGVVHVAGEGACSWHDFAAEIFRQAGKDDVELRPCTTEEFPRPAPRPAYSVLGSERAEPLVLPAWQDGVAAYLATRVTA
jgi:dTDP-4-dehydrorhamnose reductase